MKKTFISELPSSQFHKRLWIGSYILKALYRVIHQIFEKSNLSQPITTIKQLEQEYDYIIVGAGSASSVIANRLSTDPSIQVCLMEAGCMDHSPRIQIPAGTVTLYKSNKYSWNFYSTPQKELNNRQIHCPRGKMLGGSSSMNSMLYIRGLPSDYDAWDEEGCFGWAWKDVLPFFKKSEQNLLKKNNQYHGLDGELTVDNPPDPNPLSHPFIQADRHLNLKHNTDFNGEGLEGVGIYNVTQKDGKRLSSFKAFVTHILNRPNLTVITECEVEKINHINGVVNSIEVCFENKNFNISVSKELILSAGTFISPLLLLKSGIGPKEELENATIKCELDLPGVGKNLQEHIDGLVTVRTKNTSTLGLSIKALKYILPAPFNYILNRKGWMTTNYVEASGFAKTPLAGDLPDVQFHFVPGYRSHRGRLFEWGHGYAIHACVLSPKSIDEVRISEDKKLEIDYKFLERKKDMQVLIEGIKLAENLLKQPDFKPLNGDEILPRPNVSTENEYEEYVRNYAATVFHPVSTC